MYFHDKEDCFEIKKDAGFFSPVSKQLRDFSQHDTLNLPLSPISSTETYEKLREKYRLSLQKMVNEKKLLKSAGKQSLRRRQSRADISTMLNEINTIAATPLKFYTDNTINLLNSAKKNSSRKQKLFLQRTALEMSAAKKNISDIFASYFPHSYKRGNDVLTGASITDMTPPAKPGRSRVELLDVHEMDRYMHYVHNRLEAVTPATKTVTPLKSDVPASTIKRTAKKVVISQRTPEVFRPEVVSPSPLAHRSPAKRTNLSHEVDHTEQFTSSSQPDDLTYWSTGAGEEDPSIDELLLLQGQDNPMSSQPGSRRVSSNPGAYSSPVSAKKKGIRDELNEALERLAEEQRVDAAPFTPDKLPQGANAGLLQTCIDFSARKAASLVRSVQKQDRSVRKSLSSLRPTLRPDTGGDFLARTAPDDLYASYMDPMNVSFQQQQQYEQLEAELMQRLSPLPAPRFSHTSPETQQQQTWRVVSTPPPSTSQSMDVLRRTPQSSTRGLANVSTGKLIRTASRQSIAASLSSIEEMGLLLKGDDRDNEAKASPMRRAVSAPAQHFSPSLADNYLASTSSTTPLRESREAHGHLLHSSSVGDGLEQQASSTSSSFSRTGNNPTNTAAAVMNAVRSTLKSRQSIGVRQSIGGRVNEILSRHKIPLATPARPTQAPSGPHCSSLASAMKFDFEVSEEFYCENNNSFSDMNRLQSLNSRYSVAPTPGRTTTTAITPGKTPRRQERDVKMKALFRSCDSVLSQISSII